MIYRLYIAGRGDAINAAMTVGIDSQISFLFDPANTDYQRFTAEILAGASLQDADGNTLTPADAMTFVHGLPK